MNNTVRALAAALLLGTAATAGVALTQTAAEAATIKTPAVAKLMKEAQAAARSGNYREALAKAQQAEGQAKGGEGAVVLQFIAYAATQSGNYGVALNAYDRMISAGIVNRTEGLRTALRLALRANQPARALQYANQLGGADAGLVAQIQFQQGNYREVIRLLSPQMSGNPGRDTLVLLQNSYYRLHDEAGTTRVLEALALHYPSPETWHDIIHLQASKAGSSDRGLLEVYRMRNAVGDLKTHDDYFEAAEVSIAQNLPNEAKSIMDKAVAGKLFAAEGRDQRLVTLVNTRLAQDAATMARVKQAADANPRDGNDDIRYAEMLWTYGKYPEAEQYARRGIKEGALRDPDLGQIVLGHILLSAGKRGEASQAFNSVSKTGKLGTVGRLWSLMARAGVRTAQD